MKNLKLLFLCENYTELADILGIRRSTIYKWKNNGIPDYMKGILELVKIQQTELIKLNRILIAIDNNEIDFTSSSSAQKD